MLDSAAISERKLLPYAYCRFTKINKMKANGLAAQEIMNLKIAFLMKVDRNHQKFRTKKSKTDWIGKILVNLYHQLY